MRKRVAPLVVPAERDLAAAWAGTSGTVALQGGESLRVVYPGRRNPDPGPDFLDAVLETEGGKVRGAVELHRHTSDWTRHGHGADPRYAEVVLHVVGRDDGAAAHRPGGGTLPLLELAAAAEADAPAETGLRFPCTSAVRAGRDLVPALESAGKARFLANVARLRGALAAAADPGAREQVAYEALAEALGYSRNSEPLRTLAQALPLRGVCGASFAAAPGAQAPGYPYEAGSSRLPAGTPLLNRVQSAKCKVQSEGIGRSHRRFGLGRRGPASAGAALRMSSRGSKSASEGVPPAAVVGGRPVTEPTQRHGPSIGAGSGAVGLEALFLGTAGLLPSQRHLRLARRRDAYVDVLERHWAELQTAGQRAALRAYAWEMGRVRPENGPVRRVVALAHLALRWPERGLLAALRDAFRPRPKPDPRTANRHLASLVSLPCPPGYWAQHWDFGVPTRFRVSGSGFQGPFARETRNEKPETGAADGDGEAIALVGPSRAADVVVNVLLPLVAAVGELEGDGALAAAAGAAYAAHPLLAENWITRLVRERAGLPLPGPVRTARAQQGLIAIYEGPCRDLRCSECELGRTNRA